MPAPPAGKCHFPVMREGRRVWCGNDCKIIDPNTGDFSLWCGEHSKELHERLRVLRADKDRKRGWFVPKKAAWNKR